MGGIEIGHAGGYAWVLGAVGPKISQFTLAIMTDNIAKNTAASGTHLRPGALALQNFVSAT